jgi:hypothetical protein
LPCRWIGWPRAQGRGLEALVTGRLDMVRFILNRLDEAGC